MMSQVLYKKCFSWIIQTFIYWFDYKIQSNEYFELKNNTGDVINANILIKILTTYKPVK